MNNWNDIEQWLKTSANATKEVAPPEAWHAIRAALHPEKKRRVAVWWWLAPVVLLGVAIGYKMTLSNKTNTASKYASSKANTTTDEVKLPSDNGNVPNKTTTSGKYANSKVNTTDEVKLRSDNGNVPNEVLHIEAEPLATLVEPKPISMMDGNINKPRRIANDKPSVLPNVRNENNRSTISGLRKQSKNRDDIRVVKRNDTEQVVSVTNLNDVSTDVANDDVTKQTDDVQTELTNNSAILKVADSVAEQKISLNTLEKTVEQTTSKEKPTTPIKITPDSRKWIPQIQVSVAALHLNIFDALASLRTDSSIGANGFIGVNFDASKSISDVQNLANHLVQYHANVLWRKASGKRSELLLGATANYTSYNYLLFARSYENNAIINNGFTGSLAGATPTYSTRPSLITSASLQSVRNRALGLGISAGFLYNAKQFAKGKSLQLQFITSPHVLVAKKIFLTNTTSSHFFIDNKSVNNWQIAQQLSLRYQTFIGLQKISVGPVVNWNLTKLNKEKSNLQNLQWSSFGVQLCWELNKKK